MTADEAAGTSPALRRDVAARWLLRLLYAFWAVLLVGLGTGAGVLQVLAPPNRPVQAVAEQEKSAPPIPNTQVAAVAKPKPAPAASAPQPPPDTHAFTPGLPPVAPVVPPAPPPSLAPGAIALPEPGLLEPSALYPGARLPRIGANRHTAMQAYAAAFDPTDPRPRVAVLLAGIGMNEAESLAAIAALPAPVSLAVSPYTAKPDQVLDAARSRGHELLVSIPMEPQGYPLNDPGNRALLTGATQASNAQRLKWALTRFAGYVGATGALGELRGERFAAATDQMAPLLDTLADRGLLYVDPRPNVSRLAGAPAQRGAGRGVDIVLDDPAGRAELDQHLAWLEQLARDRGAAIGLAGRPSPLNVDRIAVWASTLATRGLSLAPVSVVVQMPQAASVSAPPAVRTNLLR